MAIMVRRPAGGDFTPAPPGQHAAVCCDVADLGEIETKWGTKPKVRVYWQIEKHMEDGRPFLVTRTYTASLHEKASLRQDLEAWRGRAFTEEELDGFDLEKLLGVPALLQVSHKPRSDGQGVYAQLSGIMRLPSGMQAPSIDPAYKRWRDRQDEKADPSQYEPPDDETPPMDDGDIPF